jgi:hypothetical protein
MEPFSLIYAGDRLAYGLAAGLLAAGFRTGGFFGAAFSFGKSSSLTLALSQCKKKVGSGS